MQVTRRWKSKIHKSLQVIWEDELILILSENARLSRRDNREFASNVTDESDSQEEKHDSQITSSDPGR
jgi:hypothetical protein